MRSCKPSHYTNVAYNLQFMYICTYMRLIRNSRNRHPHITLLSPRGLPNADPWKVYAVAHTSCGSSAVPWRAEAGSGLRLKQWMLYERYGNTCSMHGIMYYVGYSWPKQFWGSTRRKQQPVFNKSQMCYTIHTTKRKSQNVYRKSVFYPWRI